MLFILRVCIFFSRNIRREALFKIIVKMLKGDEVVNFDMKKVYWVKD